MWSISFGNALLNPESSFPFRIAEPNDEIAPRPVIPSHSASRELQCAISACNPTPRRGRSHRTLFDNSDKSGAHGEISVTNFKNKARKFAAAALSISGPSADIYLASLFPTNPLTLEVVNQPFTMSCQRSSCVEFSQRSNADVGSNSSSRSTVTRPQI